VAAKVLVVEDSPEFRKMISSVLAMRFDVDTAETLQAARAKLQQSTYSLILLDVLLPDGLGFDFCCELKMSSSEVAETPIIFLTGRNAVSDKVYGFSIGAEDYLTKPFEPAELLARVESKVNKAQKSRVSIESLKRGPFRFDIPSLSLFIELNGAEQKVDITPIEFKVLLKLAQNNHRVFSRQQLIDSVWGNGVYIEDRCVDKHISTLRKKISPHGKAIKTISGVGYELHI
jgi:DNA-binding response OmpR family regulator